MGVFLVVDAPPAVERLLRLGGAVLRHYRENLSPQATVEALALDPTLRMTGAPRTV